MDPYFVHDSIRIYQGDALAVMAAQESGTFALLVCDPPYFRMKDEWWDKQWDDAAAFLAWMGQLCDEFRRLLAPNGSLYLFASPGMCYDVRAVVAERFNVLNVARWYKERGTFSRADRNTWRSYCEPWEAVVFAEQWGDQYGEAERALHKEVYAPMGRYIQLERERAGLTRNDVEVALGYTASDDPARGTALCYRWEEGSSLPTREAYYRLRQLLNECGNGRGEYLRQEYEDLRQEYEDLRREYEDLRREYEDLRRPFRASDNWSDLWTYNPVSWFPGKHPTEKPLAMIEDIIRTSSRPGDLVGDFFLGRGTTAEAARNLGRRFVGCDIMEEWCRASSGRLRQETFGDGWLEQDAGPL